MTCLWNYRSGIYTLAFTRKSLFSFTYKIFPFQRQYSLILWELFERIHWLQNWNVLTTFLRKCWNLYLVDCEKSNIFENISTDKNPTGSASAEDSLMRALQSDVILWYYLINICTNKTKMFKNLIISHLESCQTPWLKTAAVVKENLSFVRFVIND